MTNNRFIIRRVHNLSSAPTSHRVGNKKVLLSKFESKSSITQIAETVLEAGEFVENHTHETMNEHFIFQSGVCKIKIGDEEFICEKGTFVMIPAGIHHSLFAQSQSRFITIGVAINQI